MAIVVVARWKGEFQKGLPLAKEVASLLKKHGALSVRAGNCHSGPHAGDIYTAVTFADWESFATGQTAMTSDPEIVKIYAEATTVLQLQERSVLVVEDL